MITDTHTHLYSKEFDKDRETLVEQALAAGITRFYLPNIDSGSIERMLALEQQYPNHCFAMMGLHPCHVNQTVEKELELVKSWLGRRPFAAIGEIGIDLYWDKTFLEAQHQAFKVQIEWALEYGYPIVIHCRNAFDEVYAVLGSFARLPKGIFHCFSGNLEQAHKILALKGFKLGIGGVVTFKNAGLDKVVEQLELSDLVLETDAPYLAPLPHRGKRNEPAYLRAIAQKVAGLKNVGVEEVAKITSANADFIFERV
jgi:TatD DNase family protein